MGQRAGDRFQLAGFDGQERGFSRPVELEAAEEGGVRAVLRYERLQIATHPCATQEEALQRLIERLQAEGYRQLRSQRSFRDGLYLGSQELWIEYPDPAPRQRDGWWTALAEWFKLGAAR